MINFYCGYMGAQFSATIPEILPCCCTAGRNFGCEGEVTVKSPFFSPFSTTEELVNVGDFTSRNARGG